MEEIIPVLINIVADIPHLAWAQGNCFNIPYSLWEKYRLLDQLESDGSLNISAATSRIDRTYGQVLRLQRAFTENKPLSSRLPVSYQVIPPRIRSLLASVIGYWRRRQVSRWASFPSWPLDLSADFLDDLANNRPGGFATGPTAVILTHDIDSAAGLANLVNWFLKIEEEVGARSMNFMVPCAWPIDHNLLEQVHQRGHEIGIHGYDHSNRTPFVDSETRRRRLAGARDLMERYGARGYRAPSLLRTRALFKDLAGLFSFDSSIPTSGGLFPVPNNGCASARPFIIEGIMEIPLTMPRDGSLRFLGYSPQQVLDLWIDCAHKIAASGGIVVLLTHCEAHFSGNKSMLEIYRHFLELIASSTSFIFSSMAEVFKRAGDSSMPGHNLISSN
jgi:ribosome modulation factor